MQKILKKITNMMRDANGYFLVVCAGHSVRLFNIYDYIDGTYYSLLIFNSLAIIFFTNLSLLQTQKNYY